jgi:heme-degrading monooxygenase HmoA
VIAVIFEATFLGEAERERYLEIATRLRPLLTEIDGFLGIERFQSFDDANRILSLSTWRDQGAINTWRNLPEHVLAQKEGKERLFSSWSIQLLTILSTRSSPL